MTQPKTVQARFPGGRTLDVLEHRARAHDFATWEREAVEAVLAYLERGMVVYDVGAEEGEFSALWGKVVGPERVYLFEPTPSVWPNIRAVWQANFGHSPRPGDVFYALPGGMFHGFVSDRSVAVAPPGGRRYLSDGWPACSDGRLQPDSRFSVVHERPDIQSITIDDHARLHAPPDVIVCDVEGAECLVVEGATQVLTIKRPELFVSVHADPALERHRSAAGVQSTRARLFDLMHGHGYVERLISTDHEEHWQFTPAGRAR